VTGVGGALAGAVVLLLVLLAWVRAEATSKNSLSAWDGSLQGEGESVEGCPQEIVSQIFSADDLEFISGLESPGLQRLFRRERTAVALHWVRETSTIIRRIMRRHLRASRLSADLEIATEARVFLKYTQLKLICGILYVFIVAVGPQGLASTVRPVQWLTQSIREVLREFESATELRELHASRTV
jgi:hypothetical protein